MAVAAAKLDAVPGLLAQFPAPSGDAAWSKSVRAGAEARLNVMGAPVRRDEYFRFVNPAPLLDDAPEVPVFARDETPPFADIDVLTLVFVDGVFDPAQSDALTLNGVEITPLADVLATDIHWAQDLFGVLEEAGQTPVARPFAVLNTARATSGFVFRATGAVEKPIVIRYLRENPSADIAVRHMLKVEEGAKITVLENGPAAARHNKVWETDIADSGEFHHIRTQGRDHGRLAATAMFTRLGRASVFKSFTLTVNGILTRNEHVITLTGDDAVAHVAGACAGDGRGFSHDDTVFITHDAENCESRQVFKKVLRSGATGVFQGKILVKEGAQKTDGYQISQGLLLDDDSQFLAKPELEIYADDVVCSHGSTCGAVDETALFYLLSRGVPRAEAQNMLVLAFLDEAVQEIEDDRIADNIRHLIGGWIERRST